MDPKAFAEKLIASRAAREADEHARHEASQAQAHSDRQAARLMQQALMERLVPYFRELKGAADGAFDCKAVSDPGRPEISWLIFQFDGYQTFRIGMVGGHLDIQRRDGIGPSDFKSITPDLQTLIVDASDLTEENIGALLDELHNFPPPMGILGRFRTDLDGNPID